MIVYLLWFNEWESSYVLGVFESKKQAEEWKNFFIACPPADGYCGDFEHYSQRDDYKDRFAVEECMA